MDITSTYNGWTNYETWCVHLWLTNDSGSYCYWSDQATVHLNDSARCAQVMSGTWTREDAARYSLASELKESFEQYHPFHGDHLEKLRRPDVFTDLLDAAISEVNWDEVASSFLDDLEPTDDIDPEGI